MPASFLAANNSSSSYTSTHRLRGFFFLPTGSSQPLAIQWAMAERLNLCLIRASV